MKTEFNRKPIKLRPGTPEHDLGLAVLQFAMLVDLCSPVDKRRRSELAVRISTNTVSHEDVSVAA